MSQPTTSTSPLQFSPNSSIISPPFWSSLTELKLHKLKLSEEPIAVKGSYHAGREVKDRSTGQMVGLSSGVEVEMLEGESNPTPSSTDESSVQLNGTLINYNTIEDFKKADKAKLLEELGDKIWSRISTSQAPSLIDLNPFLILTFSDLKKYKYYYWCGFPALLQKPGWEVIGDWSTVGTDLEEKAKEGLKRDGMWWSGETLFIIDPSSHPTAPGWPLRNVLTYLNTTLSISSLTVVCVRESHSISAKLHRVDNLSSSKEKLSTVGWEKNEKGNLGPRVADLGPLMDPTRLADQAVDLNLQLMRWRIMPELDLEKVKNTKVLLLGAGTLGCYVARTLMAWGVRKITLVDSSTVSFSNPVRQPLFEFEDSLNGGKPKAAAAAASLKRIYPGVDAQGIHLSIPMPGHPIPSQNRDKAKEDVRTLEKLIEEHDVVYLLMDSRESRWLPTVLGAAKRKLVMNVALGFDTYLVMRHGLINDAEESEVKPDIVPGAPYKGRLGCYYCNDIVAPMDSLTDRTLDQMCTVTRPGLASIASSTAVELMVSVLQHPLGPGARSDIPLPNVEAPVADPSTSSCLGIVPHQIRGFLAQFNNLKITGQAYNKCTGCSSTVIKAYEEGGFDMLEEAFGDAKYLEKLTGLDKLFEESEKLMGSLDWDEDDEDE